MIPLSEAIRPYLPGERPFGPVGTTIAVDVTGVDAASRLDVRNVATLGLYLTSGTWSTTVVEIKRSLDGEVFFSFDHPKTVSLANTFVEPFDVRGIPVIGFDVTTSSAGEALRVFTFGDRLSRPPDDFALSRPLVYQAPTNHGRLIQVTGTTSGGAVTLATALEGVVDPTWDLVTIKAVNRNAAGVDLTLEWGGTGAANEIVTTLASKSGLVNVVVDQPLRDGAQVKAYASALNDVSCGVIVTRQFRGLS